jgi:hypothetical protein
LSGVEAGIAETWQRQVEGTWHGFPSIFDATGRHLGHVQADRSIFERGGERLIQVKTTVDCAEPTRSRLEHAQHLLRVKHAGTSRVYDGEDFFGAGLPYGSLVLGSDYCLPWTSDNRVTVHVLPDGKTQAYSTLLYQGPAIHAVINGIYRLSHDYASNAETRAQIDAFVAGEKAIGARPYLLPKRGKGTFTGELEVYSASQEKVGRSAVSIAYTPVGLARAETVLRMDGPIARELRFVRTRHENQHFFEGPDVFGNAIGYGRALYTTQHVRGEALRIRGREFILDDRHTMSVVWELFRDDRLEHVAHGVLTFRGEGEGDAS